MARARRPGALTPSPGTARAVPWLHLTRRLPSLAAPELAPPSQVFVTRWRVGSADSPSSRWHLPRCTAKESHHQRLHPIHTTLYTRRTG
eukprot:scaffold101924_cov58-Phaeocystis_antarctica.AAC.10